MKKIIWSLACALLFLVCPATVGSLSLPSYRPARGYVPDAKTAIRIAVAVWSPIYGQRAIQREKPYQAALRHGIWTVTGSLPQPKPGHIILGGVPMARIAKSDGRILQVIHGK